MKGKEILISGAIVYKRADEKLLWFLVQQDSGDWEIPKTAVRRGESSVRASIRMTGEQGGMRAKVLEEVGRSSGSTQVNGKIVPQKHIFYLLLQRGESEVLGFVNSDWFEYSKASRKLSSKKEQNMLEKARDMAKEIQKHRKKEDDIEDELELMIEPQN